LAAKVPKANFSIGVFKTTNGGKNWHAFNRGLLNSTVLSLLRVPRAERPLYAGTVDAIFESKAGRNQWSSIGPGLPFTVSAMAFDPTQPRWLYAGSGGRVYKSNDAGKKWQEVSHRINYLWHCLSFHEAVKERKVFSARREVKTMSMKKAILALSVSSFLILAMLPQSVAQQKKKELVMGGAPQYHRGKERKKAPGILPANCELFCQSDNTIFRQVRRKNADNVLVLPGNELHPVLANSHEIFSRFLEKLGAWGPSKLGALNFLRNEQIFLPSPVDKNSSSLSANLVCICP
jgi:hypothetical protein